MIEQQIQHHRKIVLPRRVGTHAFLALAAAGLGLAWVAHGEPVSSHPPAAGRSVARPQPAAWPPGTDLTSFELRDGQILVRATLHSPSGHDASGFLIFDTGAPALVVTLGVWNSIQLDTLEMRGSEVWRIRRPLGTVDLGSTQIPNLTIEGLVADSLLDSDEIGLFGPSLLGDRAVVVDYEARTLAIVNRSLTLVARDTATGSRGGRGSLDFARRSRARFGAVLPRGAVPVPIRMFRGGRMLVSARIEEPERNWQSPSLALLLDTGASACVIFDDVVTERVPRMTAWPRLSGPWLRTTLGSFPADQVLLPRLRLIEASPSLFLDRVEAGAVERRALPDIQGELPDPVHGLLGQTFLGRFRLIVDYADEVLWLVPRTDSTGADAAATMEGRAQVGLRLGRLWGRLTVAAVAPGSPAAASDIEFGDTVVSIDGTRTADVEAADAERLLEGTAGSTVVVVVRRGGMERVLHLVRRGSR